MGARTVSPAEFHRLWNEFAANGQTLDALRQRLGLKGVRPLQTRAARMRAEGHQLATFGKAATSPPPSAEVAPASPSLDVLKLKAKVSALDAQLKAAQKEQVTEAHILENIIGLTRQRPEPPSWLVTRSVTRKSPGVPTLFASDWHWGEVVDPAQIGGVNEFNPEIAHRRARRLIEQTIYLLKEHMVNPDYPGIVFALGGDMFSGDIHEELMATNEREIMPTFLEIHGVLIWCIQTLAKEFGRVFVPCVTGNHGRNTHKIRAKGRNFTNFDWLLYQLLAKHFASDERIKFSIPDGSDCLYRVYSHRYLLTHGDQFRGGDGMIGALGPIIRGDHKKRSRNNQIEMGYDTMMLGHWHQLIQLQRLIVNGSLKGYDEYAYQGNFGFEPPRQALWLTHPEHGITFSMPVMVENQETQSERRWVSWEGRQGGGGRGGGKASRSKKAMTVLPESNVRAVVAALDGRGMKNPAVQVGVLCCVAKESAFVPKVEYSYGGTSNARLRRIFGARLRPYSEAALSALKRNDVAFFDVVYGGRFGNSKPGDGFKYRGRGFNQVTFHDLYKQYGDMAGVDLVSNPEKLNEVETAAKVCAAYFEYGFTHTAGKLKSRYGVTSVAAITDPKVGLQVAVNANAAWGSDTRGGGG